jgi:putative membrane protein
MSAAADRFGLVGGLVVLAALWLGPLVPMSRIAFSPHMLLHLGVVVVAAPLLAISLSRRIPAPRNFADALLWYLLGAAFEMLAVWGWHIPLLHDYAGRTPIGLGLEQASFLAGGLALWTAAWTARTRPARAAVAIALFLTFAHMSMFGLILALAPRLLYDPDLCQGAFGLASLDDQHLGGALMVAGALPYLVATAFVCYRAVSRAPSARAIAAATGARDATSP